MNVIISKSLKDIYRKFILVDSFKKVRDEIKDAVETVIIHDPVEDVFNSGVFMSELSTKGIHNFIYINENPDIQIKTLINGLQGHTYTEEFYLEDEEELVALLENIQNEPEASTSLAVSNIKIVSDFMQSYVRGEQKASSPFYLNRVNTALQELSTINHQQELALTEMGNSSLKVFEKASTIIRDLVQQNQNTAKMLEEFEKSGGMAETSTSKVALTNSVSYFPSYRYTGNAKVLLVREFTPCRYLTSFLLAYTHYVHYIVQKRVKFIVCYQRAFATSKRYEEMFTTIGEETTTLTSLYDQELIATSTPKKELLREIFSRQADLFIVLDRMYGREPIVDGKVKLQLNAISGAGDLKRYNIKPETVISSVPDIKNQMFFLPNFKGYPDAKDMRYAAYDTYNTANTSPNFQLLDKRLELVAKN